MKGGEKFVKKHIKTVRCALSPKAKQPETEIPSQPAVYTVHDRKFIVDTVYKDEPAETLKTYKKGH